MGFIIHVISYFFKIFIFFNRCCLWTIEHAHNGFVNSIIVDHKGTGFYSCSNDKYIKRWNLKINSFEGGKDAKIPVQTYQSDYGLFCMDHSYKEPLLVTGGEKLDIWDATRTVPRQSFDPCEERITSVKFNKIENHLVALSAKDNGVFLYDIKSGVGIRKFYMKVILFSKKN